ncbi:tRNA wybutosine-synthesizing protein 2 [Cyphellophora attinorum]|uniref:tRNA wybutosine-synthesizing protein 2 n=1 Tax=Cyphellophora attinorum TaxID=1664694 RepID=A0A0N1H7J9_9EURO|nr:tRNA wybutosine-synthesizing protein 2 [Phialophora attinorum]KPI39010.1 tRNA wybutosine-synthesizing protein 2 [Phialophora attinorum]
MNAKVSHGRKVENPAEYRPRPPKAKKKSSSNPLLAGINKYFSRFHPGTLDADIVLPSRYLLYPPLLLLPAQFESTSPKWQAEYENLGADLKYELFQTIALSFRAAGQNVTHIALNGPVREVISIGGNQLPNMMRSPTAFCPVYGDWGPTLIQQAGPTAQDFEQAFWISTKQDHGVTQTWAPRWTMFSQGNLSEKKRILGTAGRDYFEGQNEADIERMEVLDMYVGIGYFALCYLARGVSRVWGWDLNGWSIEGLRRGCVANGWRCLVVEVSDDGKGMAPPAEELVRLLQNENDLPLDQRTRCIAFRGNNEHAAAIVGAIDEERRRQDSVTQLLRFDHVNLGLLPDSRPSWSTAMELAAESSSIVNRFRSC